MNEHRYFQKLAHPTDVEAVWAAAERLTAETLPSWLTLEDIPDYRRCPCLRFDTLTITEQSTFLGELQSWEDRGFIVEEQGGQHVIYMNAPPREAVWSIALYAGATLDTLTLTNSRLTCDEVTDVPATGVADPFLIRRGNEWHLFFEVLNWAAYQGEIGHAVSDDGRNWQYDCIVLREPFHLSYPYVFDHDGDVWMIPETHHAGGVRLYRAAPFPHQWELVATLLEGPYFADSSIVQWEDHWYLFADTSPGGSHDTLRLFYSEHLQGPWREHPRSPVVQGDPVNAHPAGRVVQNGESLIRFAQNSVPEYGTDLRGFRIRELTPTTYREESLLAEPLLGPSGIGWNAHGMHHIDAHRLEDGTWLAAVDGWYLPAADAS
ncbi:hypothetical protein BH11PLA2_BH11PLA2_17710 [soil metagenome]